MNFHWIILIKRYCLSQLRNSDLMSVLDVLVNTNPWWGEGKWWRCRIRSWRCKLPDSMMAKRPLHQRFWWECHYDNMSCHHQASSIIEDIVFFPFEMAVWTLLNLFTFWRPLVALLVEWRPFMTVSLYFYFLVLSLCPLVVVTWRSRT